MTVDGVVATPPTIFVSAEQTLSILHISHRTLYRKYIEPGLLKSQVFYSKSTSAGGRRHRVKFLRADVEKLMADKLSAQERTGTTQ